MITLHSGAKSDSFDPAIFEAPVEIAKSENRPPQGWEEAMRGALAHPVGTAPLESRSLADVRVVVITDDWGRPTPASRVIPQVLEKLKAAGARDDAITFVTGSGMHDPMSEADLRRKLGDDIVRRYRCLIHDGGDAANLVWMGLSSMGTPIWVNRAVAEAGFRVAIGRVYLHNTHGYEGGYKMILPGVSSFETIVRDHGMNFAPRSNYGFIAGNWSRRETDNVGRQVGLDFVVNFVMNRKAEPVWAYAGEPMLAHRAAIAFGERHVWGAKIGGLADVTIAAPGPEGAAGLDRQALSMAMFATRPGGTIVLLARDEEAAAKPPSPGPDELRDLSMGDLLRLHEKRDWNLSPREIAHKVKSVRVEFYRRRLIERGMDLVVAGGRVSDATLAEYKARAAASLADAVRDAAARYGTRARVVVLPEAVATLPLTEYAGIAW